MKTGEILLKEEVIQKEKKTTLKFVKKGNEYQSLKDVDCVMIKHNLRQG